MPKYRYTRHLDYYSCAYLFITFHPVNHYVVSRINLNVDLTVDHHVPDCLANNVQVPASIVIGPPSEKSAVEISKVVINRSTSTVSPGKLGVAVPEERDVRFGPRILMTPDDHAGIVFPKKQKALKFLGETEANAKKQHRGIFYLMIEIVILIDPIFEGKICKDIITLGDKNLPYGIPQDVISVSFPKVFRSLP